MGRKRLAPSAVACQASSQGDHSGKTSFVSEQINNSLKRPLDVNSKVLCGLYSTHSTPSLHFLPLSLALSLSGSHPLPRASKNSQKFPQNPHAAESAVFNAHSSSPEARARIKSGDDIRPGITLISQNINTHLSTATAIFRHKHQKGSQEENVSPVLSESALNNHWLKIILNYPLTQSLGTPRDSTFLLPPGSQHT